MAILCRVTVSEVTDIYDTNMDSDKIQRFIQSAHVLVNSTLASSGLAADVLKEIELWISAHFIYMRDPQALRSKIGDSEAWHFPASVTTAFARGLNLTPYGQQALVFDTTGSLASLGKQKGKFRAAPRENSGDFTSGL